MRLDSTLGHLLGLSTAVAISLLGCMPQPATYQMDQAALVAPPTPPLWEGARESTGLALGNSTVLWDSVPHRSAESRSGLYVAKTQFDGRLHLDLVDGKLAFWVPLSYGLSSGAFQASPCLIDKPSSGVFSSGLGLALAIDLTPQWTLGFSSELMWSFVPMRVEKTCVANCDEVPLYDEDEESDTVGLIRFSLYLGYDFGSVRVFGGVTFRNHPSNTQVSFEEATDPEDLSGEVSFGPLYAIVGGGAVFEVLPSMDVLVQVYQPLPLEEEEILYGPIAGVSFDLHVAEDYD